MGLTDPHHQDLILNKNAVNPNPNPNPCPSPNPSPNPNPNPYLVPNHRSLFRNHSPLNSSASSPSSNSSYCSTLSEMKAAASMVMMRRRSTTPERRYDSINTKITRLNHILRNLDESKGALIPSASATHSLQSAPATHPHPSNLFSNGTTNLGADTRSVHLGPADYDRHICTNLAPICTRENQNHHSDRLWGSTTYDGHTDSSHSTDRAATQPAFAFVGAEKNRGRQMWPCNYDLHPNPLEAVVTNRFIPSALDHYHGTRYPSLISGNQGSGLASTRLTERLIAPDYSPTYEPNYRDCTRLASPMNPESARSMNHGVAGMMSRNVAMAGSSCTGLMDSSPNVAMMGSSCIGNLDSGRSVAMMGSCGMSDSDSATRGAGRRRAKGPSHRKYGGGGVAKEDTYSGRINKDGHHTEEEKEDDDDDDDDDDEEQEDNDDDGEGHGNGDDSFVKVAKMANEILTRIKRLEARQTNHHKKKLSITTNTTTTNKENMDLKATKQKEIEERSLLETVRRRTRHQSACSSQDEEETSPSQGIPQSDVQGNENQGSIDDMNKRIQRLETDVQLCWSAINQLCIENAFFRDQQRKPSKKSSSVCSWNDNNSIILQGKHNKNTINTNKKNKDDKQRQKGGTTSDIDQ